MLDQPHPELEELLETIGEAGRCLADMRASEGAAGNISLYIGWSVEVRRRPVAELTALAQPVPKLAGHSFIISSLKLENLIQEMPMGEGSSLSRYVHQLFKLNPSRQDVALGSPLARSYPSVRSKPGIWNEMSCANRP